MANICDNRLYCSTDNDRNMEKIIRFLNEEFDISNLDAQDNFIHADFSSRWTFPEEEFEKLTADLEDDPTLFIEVVSFEPGMRYLEAHLFENGDWQTIP